MRINSNLLAENANRNLGVNRNKKTKSTEKLSSGMKLNRSADDAAGLAISEKMRAQIRGLNQASRNIGDGISLIQTADGAMQEIQNLLQRERELVIQGMSDTNEETVDKEAVQAELDQINKEIDNIAHATTYNNKELLYSDPAADVVIALDISGSMSSSLASVKSSLSDLFSNMPEGSKVGFVFFSDARLPSEPIINIPLSSDVADLQSEINKVTLKGGGDEPESGFEGISDAINILSAGSNPNKKIIYITDAYAYNSSHTAASINSALVSAGIELHACAPPSGYGYNQAKALVSGTGGSTYDYRDLSGLRDGTFTAGIDPAPPLWIQGGANQWDGMYVDRYNCVPQALFNETFTKGVDVPKEDGSGSTNVKISKIVVDPFEEAEASIVAVDEALNKVSGYRATAGAQQNRLEHKVRNVDSSSENLTASESRIRDADMAKEMAEYVKNDIMSQAATAMLAQANRSPESVLQLLQ